MFININKLLCGSFVVPSSYFLQFPQHTATHFLKNFIILFFIHPMVSFQSGHKQLENSERRHPRFSSKTGRGWFSPFWLQWCDDRSSYLFLCIRRFRHSSSYWRGSQESPKKYPFSDCHPAFCCIFGVFWDLNGSNVDVAVL